MVGRLVGGFFLFVFNYVLTPYIPFFCVLGSLGAHSPSCSKFGFLPVLSYLYFPKLLPVFLRGFLVASAQPCASAVHWLAHGHTLIAYAADFGAKTEVFLSVWLNVSPCSYKNLQIFEISEFTRVLLRSSVHSSGSSITGLRESIPVPPSTEASQTPSQTQLQQICCPARLHWSWTNYSTGIPKSPKQMTCFTLYLIFPLFPSYLCLPSSTPPK